MCGVCSVLTLEITFVALYVIRTLSPQENVDILQQHPHLGPKLISVLSRGLSTSAYDVDVIPLPVENMSGYTNAKAVILIPV